MIVVYIKVLQCLWVYREQFVICNLNTCSVLICCFVLVTIFKTCVFKNNTILENLREKANNGGGNLKFVIFLLKF